MNHDLTVIGVGYVGLVSSTCFAELGSKVLCIDNDVDKISDLNRGIVSLYEPGLVELVQRNISAGRLAFSTWQERYEIDSRLILLAVGTPQSIDGNADLRFFNDTINEIAQSTQSGKVIIIKSTVPVGTAKNTAKRLQKLRPELQFDIVSNPEFLREGSAVYDFMHPDRIIIGVVSDNEPTKNSTAAHAVLQLYSKLLNSGVPALITDNNSAEFIKYASNAYLATRIAFINEVANAAGVLDANVADVIYGMGLDHRIGQHYLSPSPGFGGSCFPKDSQALLHATDNIMSILQAVVNSNTRRKHVIATVLDKIVSGQGGNRIVTILGLTFKAETDDIRDSPSIEIAKLLLAQNIKLHLYDPKGIPSTKRLFRNEVARGAVKFFDNAYSAIMGANALALLTEWSEFKDIDLSQVKKLLNTPIILDMRNIFDRKQVMLNGLKYFGFEELGQIESLLENIT